MYKTFVFNVNCVINSKVFTCVKVEKYYLNCMSLNCLGRISITSQTEYKMHLDHTIHCFEETWMCVNYLNKQYTLLSNKSTAPVS